MPKANKFWFIHNSLRQYQGKLELYIDAYYIKSAMLVTNVILRSQIKSERD